MEDGEKTGRQRRDLLAGAEPQEPVRVIQTGANRPPHFLVSRAPAPPVGVRRQRLLSEPEPRKLEFSSVRRSINQGSSVLSGVSRPTRLGSKMRAPPFFTVSTFTV